MSLAYLDPGSGGLIVSMLVGGVAAAGVAVRSARSRVTGALFRKGKKGTDAGSESTADATASEVLASEPADATAAAAGNGSTTPEASAAGDAPAEAVADVTAEDAATSGA